MKKNQPSGLALARRFHLSKIQFCKVYLATKASIALGFEYRALVA